MLFCTVFNKHLWKFIYIIIFQPLLFAHLYLCNMKHSEKVCTPRDSCALRRPEMGWPYDSPLNGISMNEYYDSNCFCDRACGVFDDCCPDSPLCKNISTSYFSCRFPRGQPNPVYTYNSCPKSYISPEVILKCEQESDPIADPYTNLPVVSLNSNITFKNIYCAVCNEQLHAVHSKSWIPILRCRTLIPLPLIGPLIDFLLNSLLTRIVYNPHNGRWEPVILGDPLVPEGCSMSFERPYGYEFLTRFCKYHTETCASSWKDEHIKKRCQSYNSYVYKIKPGNVLEKIYRNVDCAKCNYENIDQLKCFYKPGNLISNLLGIVEDTAHNVISSVSPILNVSTLGLFSSQRSAGNDYFTTDDYDDYEMRREKRQTQPRSNQPSFPVYEFSYSMLMDTDFSSGGNIVGTDQFCPQGQLYNPFRGACDSVVCSRYQRFVNGKCVPI